MSYVHFNASRDAGLHEGLPVRINLNFKKLISWWEDQASSDDPLESSRAKHVLSVIDKNPQLSELTLDINEVENFQPEIRLLLSPMFPALTSSNEIKAASMPFMPYLFNLTKRLESVLGAAEGEIQVPMQDPDMLYIFSCIAILNLHYKANINYTNNLFFDIPVKKTGILRRYRVLINADFTDIRPLKEIGEISAEDILELTDNFEDVALWKKKIPPGSFSFDGFSILTLFDVTREESMSMLKFDLLKKDALLMPEMVERIRVNLCALLNIPDLKIGFVSYLKDRDMIQSVGYGFWNSIILSDVEKKKVNETFCMDTHQCVFDGKQTLFVPEIDDKKIKKGALEKKLMQLGLKSYLAMPLLYTQELIGILELGSDQPNMVNSITERKLQDVIPLFVTALKRTQSERANQLEAIIRQKCTGIHPTVAWRFTEAAENLLDSRRLDETDMMEDIVFADVYPLYGQADIQGSSTERSQSIQADLIEHLSLAKNVVSQAVNEFPLPIYKRLRFRIDQFILQLRHELAAGDENVVLEFLRSEINPVFSLLHTLSPNLHETLLQYESRLDPVLGVVYKQRKSFEHSVKVVNDKIAEYLDKAQSAAQAMFPHYFERYKTDGVEHNLYIGQSMVNNKTYHPLYLQNLRLWQLMVMCEIENLIRQVQPQLKTKLNICSLILVQGNPLSIRFRMEEKKFDVDGAYNMRYEIVKKRIDKAYIKDSNERLTQPGKIAIVYSQESEATEYLKYLEYLQFINYIGQDIERLNINDLQGLPGLKALRADVVYQKNFAGIDQSKAIQVLEEVSKN